MGREKNVADGGWRTREKQYRLGRLKLESRAEPSHNNTRQ